MPGLPAGFAQQRSLRLAVCTRGESHIQRGARAWERRVQSVLVIVQPDCEVKQQQSRCKTELRNSILIPIDRDLDVQLVLSTVPPIWGQDQ